jgi:pimeloyl-ACP methyl ester carboxylesterase
VDGGGTRRDCASARAFARARQSAWTMARCGRRRGSVCRHPGWPSQILFADPGRRQTALREDRDRLDAHVEELLNLGASAKLLWPIPDTGIDKRLPRIKAPTLVLTSDLDTVVPAEYGPAWRDAIAHAQLKTITAAGHVADNDQPEQLAQWASGFMRAEGIAAVA